MGRLVEKLEPVQGESNAPVPDTAPPNLRVGDVVEVTITERARRNPERDGVARINGFPVIVPNTAPDQTVRIRIHQIRDRVGYAEVIGPEGRRPHLDPHGHRTLERGRFIPTPG